MSLDSRITQGLDDHCHRPTLERIDRRRGTAACFYYRICYHLLAEKTVPECCFFKCFSFPNCQRMPIIANPSAAEATKQLGFQPSVLQPGELLGKKIGSFHMQKRQGRNLNQSNISC